MELRYWPLYFIISISQIFVTGWGIYSLTANQKIIMEWISQVYHEEIINNQFSDKVILIFSILNSINGVGSIIGAIFILPLSDKYGRKIVLAICTFCNLLFTVLFVISKPINSVIPMMIGRVILGIPFALQANILVYLNEITNVRLRGLVMSLGMAWFLIGFVTQNTLALEVVLGTEKHWNYVQLIPILFVIPELLVFKWIPESIGFLNNQGKLNQVKQICQSLYGTDDEKIIGLDFDKSSDPNKSIDTKNVTWSDLWTNKTLLKVVIYILIFVILDQGAGVVQISFYSTEIIRNFEFSTLTSQIFTIVFTVLRVMASVFGSFLTTKIKRKLNLQISLFGVIIFNVALFILGFLERTTVVSIFELRIKFGFPKVSEAGSLDFKLWRDKTITSPPHFA